MLKRYKLDEGVVEASRILKGRDEAMVENASGEYVLYADVLPLLEKESAGQKDI